MKLKKQTQFIICGIADNEYRVTSRTTRQYKNKATLRTGLLKTLKRYNRITVLRVVKHISNNIDLLMYLKELENEI